MILADGGLASRGNFIIDSENILLNAEKSMYIHGEAIFVEAEKTMSTVYGDSYIVSCSDSVLNDKKQQMQEAVIYLTKTDIYNVAENLVFSGNNNATFVARKSVVLGGSTTSISGLGRM
jgi:hypothetical protein